MSKEKKKQTSKEEIEAVKKAKEQQVKTKQIIKK